MNAAPAHPTDPSGMTGGSVTPASLDENDTRLGSRTAPRRTPGPGSAPESAPDDGARIPDVSAPRRQPVSRKALLAMVLLAGSLVAVSGMALHRLSLGFAKASNDDGKLGSDRPAAASAEPRRLDLSDAAASSTGSASGISRPPAPAPTTASAGAGAAQPHRIPALEPTTEELAEPIGVRRSGAPPQAGTSVSSGAGAIRPEDAPVMLISRSGVNSAYGAAQLGTDAQPSSGHAPQEAGLGAERLDAMGSTERNLQDYQRRLQRLLDQLTQASDLVRGNGAPPANQAPLDQQAPLHPGAPVLDAPTYLPTYASLSSPAVGSRPAPTGPTGPTGSAGPSWTGQAQALHPTAQGSGLLGGQLPASATPTAMATLLGNRSLTLPKGTSFTCALKSRVVTASSGMVGCIVQRNIYSEDGRVLLIERGSHLDGEYRVTSVRPGTVRIPVLWTRVRTPLGVTVDIDSPATGQLGESGIDGHVDNRWVERIGAAMLLSLIDDSVQLIASSQSEQRQNDTVVLSSTTASTSKLAEKVLDSTINIPPLIYRNQGGIVGIYVARDIDFSAVYELQAGTP